MEEEGSRQNPMENDKAWSKGNDDEETALLQRTQEKLLLDSRDQIAETLC